MLGYAEDLNFEKAADLRDKIEILEKKTLGINENYNTALITGGCQRIGFSIVKYLASKGYNIVVQYNNSSKEIKK